MRNTRKKQSISVRKAEEFAEAYRLATLMVATKSDKHLAGQRPTEVVEDCLRLAKEYGFEILTPAWVGEATSLANCLEERRREMFMRVERQVTSAINQGLATMGLAPLKDSVATNVAEMIEQVLEEEIRLGG